MARRVRKSWGFSKDVCRNKHRTSHLFATGFPSASPCICIVDNARSRVCCVTTFPYKGFWIGEWGHYDTRERKSDLLAPNHKFSGKFWWKLMRNTCSHGQISQYWLSWTSYQMKSCPGMQSAMPETLFLSGIQIFNPRNNHILSKL